MCARPAAALLQGLSGAVGSHRLCGPPDPKHGPSGPRAQACRPAHAAALAVSRHHYAPRSAERPVLTLTHRVTDKRSTNTRAGLPARSRAGKDRGGATSEGAREGLPEGGAGMKTPGTKGWWVPHFSSPQAPTGPHTPHSLRLLEAQPFAVASKRV